MKKLLSLLFIMMLGFVFCSCDLMNKQDQDPVEPIDYNYVTPYTDATKLTAVWEGKEFIADGIGQVTLKQNVDGDTTWFKSTSGSFSTRYLGIDTPESTYKVEPWGFAASAFTKGKLQSATTIVLEADGERTDSNGRYLAWVWYRTSDTEDFRLLNLEIVENALANPKGYAGTKYATQFNVANDDVRAAHVRIYGETDPSYDPSTIGVSYSIKELRENFETLIVSEQDSFKGKVIRTEGVVTMICGAGSGYIQSYDEATGNYYSIYVYGGFSKTVLAVGRTVYVQGKIGYYNGSLQITDFDRTNSGISSFAPSDLDPEASNNNFHVYENVTISELLSDSKYQASVVTMSDLTVTSTYNSKDAKGNPTGAYTLTCKDSKGNKIEIRVSDDSYIKIEGENNGLRITDGFYFKDRVITNLYAVVGWYSDLNKAETEYANDGTQLLIFNGSMITLAAK